MLQKAFSKNKGEDFEDYHARDIFSDTFSVKFLKELQASLKKWQEKWPLWKADQLLKPTWKTAFTFQLIKAQNQAVFQGLVCQVAFLQCKPT